MRNNLALGILICLCGTTALSACGSSDAPPGPGASGGSGGSSGSGGSAGTAGMGGASGAAGSAAADAGTLPDGGTKGDAGSCDATDIRGKLLCIPGLTIVQETPAPTSGNNAGYTRFQLTLEQDVDHESPGGQRFAQSLVLWHRDETAPVVLASSGYNISSSRTELGTRFGLNTLQVEHRYFAPSIPNPADWKHLNIKQSAGDYHAIATAFKSIYKGKWVNTGASKGGMTSVYHRRFYPSDLDATVAYVAPNMLGLADPRFPEFLRQVGGDAYAGCRSSLNELQKTVLTRRAEIEPLMTGTYEELGSKGVALEHAVLEMPFTFWQYQSPTSTTRGCAAIPAADAAPMPLYEFFSAVAYLSNFSDTGFARYAPYYYQAANQLGAPGVDDAHLAGLLQHRDTYRPSSYIPKGIQAPMWDAEAMVDIQNWVKTEGKTIIFIYGEYDPWSAGRFEIGTTGDNHVFVAPAANHGANLARLNETDRANALSVLQNWLGVPPVVPFDEPPADEDETFRPRL